MPDNDLHPNPSEPAASLLIPSSPGSPGQFQGLAATLIQQFGAPAAVIPAKAFRKERSGRDPAGHDLKRYEDWLAEAHQLLAERSQQKASISYASEWVMDNYYIIRQAFRQIEEDLPGGYYQQLPRLAAGSWKGLPRIYAIASTMLEEHDFLFDPLMVQAVLVFFQQHTALTMGELWALPIFLRFSLLEMLAHTLVSVIRPATSPALPPLPPHSTREPQQSPEPDRIANIILSLRSIAELDWKDFFEAASALEATLRQDPAGVYEGMDFATRNLYRNEIEKLALAAHRTEDEVAQAALLLAQRAAERSGAQKEAHIGEYLIGGQRAALEAALGYRPGLKERLQRWAFRKADFVYLYSVALVSTFIFILLAFPANLPELYAAIGSPENRFPWEAALPIPTALLWVVVILLTLALVIPVLTIATSLVNWLITLFVRPRILPKLEFSKGIPTPFHTLVVIPALITRRDEIDSLVDQLELHYLRNAVPGLLFGLLTDYKDADQETLPQDEDLLNYALERIQALNNKYPRYASPAEDVLSSLPARRERFYLFHRKRQWNPSEGKWMGWERKRGKLHELNQLLRGRNHLSFISPAQLSATDRKDLQAVQFVITLDADSILPLGAGWRLAGTLAHPLNRAEFDPTTGEVISGYTVLQPRMEIHPRSANLSWFTRIFSGDAGLDLYSLAVSDSYQDLFGEGIYVGKGIYDVDAFQRSVDEHIPENTVLSHDLLEGLMGRSGLATDITLVEDYPQNYTIHILRQQRWIRGDWQLLPWLLNPRQFGVKFSLMDRWKIFDNLRRSLLAPALLMIFLLGTIFLPGHAGLWVSLVALSLAIPLLTGLARSTLQIVGGEAAASALRPLAWNLIRWLLAISTLIYEAYISLDAIFTTLYRLLISRRHLLQWVTAAQTTRLFGSRRRQNQNWERMGASVVAAIIVALTLQVISNISRSGLSPVFLYASLILALWMLSPLIVWWVNRPLREEPTPLTPAQETLLQQVARRTWGFFERFVGPEDHWLPPDHYQETPVGMVAHRTSPTNIGLLLTSTLAAYDLGYINSLGLATRLETTLQTLRQLERFRGHFLNWYDTLSLTPLQPRYISTVDSGNLAACLIITAQGSRLLPQDPLFRWEIWQGYLTTLSSLKDILSPGAEQIRQLISDLQAEIIAGRGQPERWYALFLRAKDHYWRDISNQLIEMMETGSLELSPAALANLRDTTAQVERHHSTIQHLLTDLLPWLPLLDAIPELFQQAAYAPAVQNLTGVFPADLTLEQLHARLPAATEHLANLRQLFSNETLPFNSASLQANQWIIVFEQALKQAQAKADEMLARLARIQGIANQFVDEMDFRFLYNPLRRVFHIGYNLDSGLLDLNYYDLLASEARIASLVAIARGDVPPSHWMYLNRPVTRVNGSRVLLSWSGTMFEYLMPPQFFRSYPGTLLYESVYGAVKHQAAYGRRKGVPWGISESGFYRLDAAQNYQYQAFGVPGLGFKRGLEDDLVIAPYASLMAVGVDPQAVTRNLEDLIRHRLLGAYGLYEAVDFTSDRLRLDEKSLVVREFMAHHQGMIMMALANFFHKDRMVQRMHSDPRIQSVELLLQEQVPHAAPLEDPAVEGVKGIQRTQQNQEEISPWKVPVQTSIPQLHLLSNGNYNVLISNMGGGYSTWREINLTRWQPDGALDPWGSWIYIQELEAHSGQPLKTWSAAQQPIAGNAAQMQVIYHAHMAVFRRSEDGIDSTLEVTVAPDAPVEIRRLHLHNNHEQTRHLRLTSYGEVVLGPPAADTRHPAFNKLFIESEFLPALNLQLFKRRLRSHEEEPRFMGHLLVSEDTESVTRHEADRNRFLGRWGSPARPAALYSDEYLGGSSGATLDPIFALGREVELSPHESKVITYVTLAAETREELIALAGRYQNHNVIERAFHQANIAAQTWLGRQGIGNQAFTEILQTLSALVYPQAELRADPGVLAANNLGQPALWPFGISGDYPILLVELKEPQEIELIREVLKVHQFLRARRLLVDVVFLNGQQTAYGAELNGMIHRQVNQLDSGEWLNQRGGIFILYADQMQPGERTLLQSAARVVLNGAKGTLQEQLPGYTTSVWHLPEFSPSHTPPSPAEAAGPPFAAPLAELPPLQFFNGFGGFSPDGREYIIEIKPQNQPAEPAASLAEVAPPAPWVNVIGYPEFGFMVSEGGSQCTWALNSGENRLTPWSNDPVRDPSGEVLYLRDEETGEFWSATPQPCGENTPYRVRHGAGYSRFEHHSHGLQQQLTLFASPEDPVKILHLKVQNTLPRTRRITATYYVEWVLGTTRSATMPMILPEYDAATECLLAANPYNAEFGQRVAFMVASKPIHGLTADRLEFLGRGGSTASPAAMRRLGLETRITPGVDACGVLQVHLDLLPGASEEFYFVLGQGGDKAQARSLARKYQNPDHVSAAYQRMQTFWQHLLETIQVRTPEPSTDLILNRWALYQALSCRIWGRTAFYQSSGAFGFRDQLQDVMALLSIDPTISRGQILNAAHHQFKEGDVMHWWHPPSGRGVRTRISDNLLWLPYVTAAYILATGDRDILEEKIPFLDAPPLGPGEEERYNEFPYSPHSATLLEHCQRAIEKGATRGQHGLPLIGTGDWNDGFNKVGDQGRGESVWLAWFTVEVLNRFARVCELLGDTERAASYRAWAQDYTAAAEETAWDGAWYRRAYDDEGIPIGSSQNRECQIDAIAQSWAVLSGAASQERRSQAMGAVLQRLVLPQERLSLLFTPPFNKTPRDPGYIKGYLPGIRENGGQYTHAATWTAWAFASLGEGETAGELFKLLNPILQADSPEKVINYRVEPYVVAADIYSTPPHVGRGGWTWYTGSAAWLYRLGLEGILGFQRNGNRLQIQPVIPPEWDGYEIHYRYGETIYHIRVQNPFHVRSGVKETWLDGASLPEAVIPLVNNGGEHQVQVVMGHP